VRLREGLVKLIEASLGSPLNSSWLALGAEVAATVADGDTLNRGATNRAGLATKVMGNPKLKMGCAQFTTRAEVGIHTSPFIINS